MSTNIYLRFITEQWSVESALIRLGTRCWASHVEFVTVNDYGTPTVTLGSRLGGGVMIRPYNYCKPSREEWWTAPHVEDAYRYGLTLLGDQYDWPDILGLAFNTNWHTNGFICSEFVAACGEKEYTGTGVLIQSSTPWLNMSFDTWRVTPRDLLLSPLVSFVKRII